jgi:immune inhibitor A
VGQNAQPVFDDSRTYYYEIPGGIPQGVIVRNTGTRIRVLSEDGTSMRIRIS